MIRAIIFDLDNCISAADEVGQELLTPVFEAIRHANNGTLTEEQLERAFSDAWRIPLNDVAEKHGFSKEMLDAGWNASLDLEVQSPMAGYGDLRALADLPVQRFLVTSGFRKLQESKVRALNLGDLFAGIYIDAIDEPNRQGKQAIFTQILQRRGFQPEEVLVVGDNPDSEIEAGNRLGLRTAQVLRPRVERGSNATYYIQDFAELQPIIAKSAESSA